MQVLNFAISLAMISLLLGAIYKVLHDEPIVWRDIAVSPFLYRLADCRSPVAGHRCGWWWFHCRRHLDRAYTNHTRPRYGNPKP
jgi:hypothetical protein